MKIIKYCNRSVIYSGKVFQFSRKLQEAVTSCDCSPGWQSSCAPDYRLWKQSKPCHKFPFVSPCVEICLLVMVVVLLFKLTPNSPIIKVGYCVFGIGSVVRSTRRSRLFVLLPFNDHHIKHDNGSWNILD